MLINLLKILNDMLHNQLHNTQKHNFLFLVFVFCFVMFSALLSHSYKKSVDLKEQVKKNTIKKIQKEVVTLVS